MAKSRLTLAILFAFLLVAIDWTQLMHLIAAGHLELEGNVLARFIAQSGLNGLFFFTAVRLLALYAIWRLAVVFPRMATVLYAMVALHVVVITNNAIALALWRV